MPRSQPLPGPEQNYTGPTLLEPSRKSSDPGSQQFGILAVALVCIGCLAILQYGPTGSPVSVLVARVTKKPLPRDSAVGAPGRVTPNGNPPGSQHITEHAPLELVGHREKVVTVNPMEMSRPKHLVDKNWLETVPILGSQDPVFEEDKEDLSQPSAPRWKLYYWSFLGVVLSSIGAFAGWYKQSMRTNADNKDEQTTLVRRPFDVVIQERMAMMSVSSSKGDDDEEEEEDEGPRRVPTGAFGMPKISLSELAQLVTMGAGAPSLGDLKEVNFNDPDKADLVFELEANNFEDSEGNSLADKNRYFYEGWVEDGSGDGPRPPGFWANLKSGGKLQEEYDAYLRKKRKAERKAQEQV